MNRLPALAAALRATLVACLLLLAPTSAWADDAHYEFQLSVDAPASTTDPFHVHITEDLVGAKPGLLVSV